MVSWQKLDIRHTYISIFFSNDLNITFMTCTKYQKNKSCGQSLGTNTQIWYHNFQRKPGPATDIKTTICDPHVQKMSHPITNNQTTIWYHSQTDWQQASTFNYNQLTNTPINHKQKPQPTVGPLTSIKSSFYTMNMLKLVL